MGGIDGVVPGPPDEQAPPTGPVPQPVAISQAVNTLIVAAVSAGWFTIDSTLINLIATFIGTGAVIGFTLKARGAVTAHR